MLFPLEAATGLVLLFSCALAVMAVGVTLAAAALAAFSYVVRLLS